MVVPIPLNTKHVVYTLLFLKKAEPSKRSLQFTEPTVSSQDASKQLCNARLLFCVILSASLLIVVKI